jgi:hypothetical protein
MQLQRQHKVVVAEQDAATGTEQQRHVPAATGAGPGLVVAVAPDQRRRAPHDVAAAPRSTRVSIAFHRLASTWRTGLDVLLGMLGSNFALAPQSRRPATGSRRLPSVPCATLP